MKKIVSLILAVCLFAVVLSGCEKKYSGVKENNFISDVSKDIAQMNLSISEDKVIPAKDNTEYHIMSIQDGSDSVNFTILSNQKNKAIKEVTFDGKETSNFKACIVAIIKYLNSNTDADALLNDLKFDENTGTTITKDGVTYTLTRSPQNSTFLVQYN